MMRTLKSTAGEVLSVTLLGLIMGLLKGRDWRATCGKRADILSTLQHIKQIQPYTKVQ
jgi:hypothetical protein